MEFSDVALARALPDLVAQQWALIGATATPLGGGMNSVAAAVDCRGRRFSAKWVPGDQRESLVSGARMCSRLSTAGLNTAQPVLTIHDDWVCRLGEGWVVLAVWVPGEVMTGHTEDEGLRMGRALGQAHRATLVGRRAAPSRLGLEREHPGLELEPWLRPVRDRALSTYSSLPELTWVMLHRDPAPKFFLFDEHTTRCGIIDWTGAREGPAMYDLASAALYLRSPDVVRAFQVGYRETGPELGDDWWHVEQFKRVRWAVRACYFSDRIARGELIGNGGEDCQAELAEARAALRVAWPDLWS